MVNSIFSRENIKRAYGLDSKVVYLGVDSTYYKPVSSEKKNYVISTGTIASMKSVHLIIDLLSYLPQEIRPELKWIANGVDKTYHAQMISLAQEKKVEFNAYISITDYEAIKLLSEALLMLYFPSLEPFGLAPLEANLCGTYVLGLAEGGLKESIKQGINGELFNNYEVQKISIRIQEFIENKNLASNKGILAREHVESYWNLNAMGDNIEAVLKYSVKQIH
jgi:glycosyltransferase involved in cell wall biosynthesis